MTIAAALEKLMRHGMPFRFEAYDGSTAGDAGSTYTVRLLNERGLRYLMSHPGDLGFARAYVAGDLEIDGIHPGDPYELMRHFRSRLTFKLPPPGELLTVLRSLGLTNLIAPTPPPEEHLSRTRRAFEGWRHSRQRDADAIHHHYDVSNRFYELVLGPSMAYTCAVYPDLDATLEQAQTEKFDLICRKLDLKPGQRLLDLGCGWGGMVRHAAEHYGVQALGVTLSEQQAVWAQQAIKEQRLDDRAEVRFLDYRDVTERDFDAISSIGLTEHIGVKNYPSYFAFIEDRLKPGGRLLNHCITRDNNTSPASAGAFIDRYVFPDGELTGVGRIVSAAHDAGLEVRHNENIREHYAMTLRDWNRNLVRNWDEVLGEVSLGTAKVWGLYMAGSRLAFEEDEIELHHVLAGKPHEDGTSSFPLRPTW